MKALVRFWLRFRYALWRWRFKQFIAETRGWHPGVRAICLALGTGETTAFVHDALFNESNILGESLPPQGETK